MSGDTGVFDLYGFELTVTLADKSDRYECAQYAQQREAKWDPYLKAQRLPEGRTLKRFVRKVRGAAGQESEGARAASALAALAASTALHLTGARPAPPRRPAGRAARAARVGVVAHLWRRAPAGRAQRWLLRIHGGGRRGAAQPAAD
jgi:hypothetical protein